MGSIRRSSISPRTKAVNVGIMLKQTNIILKYLRRDNRNRDVLPAKRISQLQSKGGWVGVFSLFSQSILLLPNIE